MKIQIAITGATGFIASQFIRYYADKYDFIKISRKAEHKNSVYSWDDLIQDPQILAKTSCVIHLSGASIGEKRWSESRKQEILDSRVKTTQVLVEVMNKLDYKPSLLCASAIGIYPTDGVAYDEYVKLDYTKYANFSEQITKQWEATATKYIGRVVNMRFGVVLSSQGGALSKILMPFKLGLGSGIADSSWSFSWISVTDLVRAIDFIAEHPDINGAVNLVAPQHISYQQLISTICQVYNKRCWFNLPKWLVHQLFGQMGDELLLSGQNVIPTRLPESGFKYIHSTIKECIQDVYTKTI